MFRRDVVDGLLAESIYAVSNALATWWWEHPETPRAAVVDLEFDLLWQDFPGSRRRRARMIDEAPILEFEETLELLLKEGPVTPWKSARSTDELSRRRKAPSRVLTKGD